MAACREQQCLKWLKENCYVNVRREWLDACIEFLKQEHRRGFASQIQLNNLVHEQLLMADFQEISLGTLPNLGTGKAVSTLQGKHTLQINSVMDVGQSAYSQILKLKGKDDIESHKENTSNNWEPKMKPSRMLFLQLTDGSKNVQAMEYQGIPCLNQSTPPGTKVQIQGPVTCRLGVLLLTSQNIKVLGGSVDELAETNSMWKMLHNAIGQEAPAEPTCLNLTKEESEQQANTQSQRSTIRTDGSYGLQSNNNISQQPYSSGNRSALTSAHDKRSSSFGQKGKSSQASKGKINSTQYNADKRPQPSNRGINSTRRIVDNNTSDNDEDIFDDNVDENFDFDQLDQIEQEVMDAFDDNLNENFDFDQLDQLEKEVMDNRKTNSYSKPDHTLHPPHNKKEFHEVFDDDFMDDDFEDFDFELNQSKHAFSRMDSGHKKPKDVLKNGQKEKRNKTEQNCLPLAKKIKSTTSGKEPNTCTTTSFTVVKTERREDSVAGNSSSSTNSFGNNRMVGVTEFQRNNSQGTNKPTGKLGLKKLNKYTNQATLKFGTQSFNRIENDRKTVDLVGSNSNAKSCTTTVVKSERWDSSSVMNDAQAVNCIGGSISKTNAESEMRTEMRATLGNKPVAKLGLKKPNKNTNQNTIEFNVPQPSLDTFVKTEPHIEVVNLIEEEDKDIAAEVESNEELETSLPFTYLSQVLKDQPFLDERTVRIKGYISTLVSHTQVADLSQRWQVIVKVNDGSASIDAAIGEEVLTELLGTPVESFQYAMLEAKKNRDPVKCRTLQQQTVQFQGKLTQLSCLMDLLFSPSQSKPLIIRLTDVSRDDILGLISRLSADK